MSVLQKDTKIKHCEGKLNICITFYDLSTQQLKRIMEEHGNVKSSKTKEVQTGQKKQAIV